MRVETADEARAMIDVDDFGYEAVYNGTVSTTVLVDEGVEMRGNDYSSISGSHTITLLHEDVPAPVRDALLVVTDETGAIATYRIDHVVENDARFVVVIATKVLP